jgi:hypothetical protein
METVVDTIQIDASNSNFKNPKWTPAIQRWVENEVFFNGLSRRERNPSNNATGECAILLFVKEKLPFGGYSQKDEWISSQASRVLANLTPDRDGDMITTCVYRHTFVANSL